HEEARAVALRRSAEEGGRAGDRQRAEPPPARDSGVHLPAHLTQGPKTSVPKLHRSSGEPVPSTSDRTGSPASRPLEAAIAEGRGWAGDSCRALLLSGSHANGEAVWVPIDGRDVSLSDVDLYACMADAASCRRAESRARRARPQLASRLLAIGLAAPL